MSLTRVVIIGALAIAFLPVDKETQDRFRASAGDAATWALTFCDRNPDTCTKASAQWAVFEEKAGFAAELAQDGLATYFEPGAAADDVARAPREDIAIGSPTRRHSNDTLHPWDRTPRWGGPRQTTGSF